MKIWSEYLYNLTHGESNKNPFPNHHIWNTFYGWQRWPGDEHKSGWTKETIFKEIEEAGFEKFGACRSPRAAPSWWRRRPHDGISQCTLTWHMAGNSMSRILINGRGFVVAAIRLRWVKEELRTLRPPIRRPSSLSMVWVNTRKTTPSWKLRMRLRGG